MLTSVVLVGGILCRTDWLKRLPHRCLGLAIIVLTSASCGQEGASPAVGSQAVAAVDSPIYAAFSDASGLSRSELSRAIDLARADVTIECARLQGFVVDSTELVPPDNLPPPRPVGGTVEQFRLLMKDLSPNDLEAENDVGSPEELNARAAAISTCWSQAANEISSPVDTVEVWLEEESEDLWQRIAADERIVQAFAAEAECIGSIGFAGLNSDEIGNVYFEQALSVFEQFRRGEIDESGANLAFDSIESEEDRVAGPISSCVEDRLDVERIVSFEYQEDFLQSREADFLAIIVSATELINLMMSLAMW